MDGWKNPATSVGIAGPAVSLLVIFANHQWPGLGLTDAEVSTVIDQVSGVAGLLMGIVGRWRATKQISLTGAPKA